MFNVTIHYCRNVGEGLSSSPPPHPPSFLPPQVSNGPEQLVGAPQGVGGGGGATGNSHNRTRSTESRAEFPLWRALPLRHIAGRSRRRRQGRSK